MRIRLRMGLEAGLEAPEAEAAGEEGPAGGPFLPCGKDEVADPGEWPPGMRSKFGRTRGLVMEGPCAGGLTVFIE